MYVCMLYACMYVSMYVPYLDINSWVFWSRAFKYRGDGLCFVVDMGGSFSCSFGKSISSTEKLPERNIYSFEYIHTYIHACIHK